VVPIVVPNGLKLQVVVLIREAHRHAAAQESGHARPTSRADHREERPGRGVEAQQGPCGVVAPQQLIVGLNVATTTG
jgi:hypothetical protein